MDLRIADVVSERQLRESFRSHATLAQLNRLWQFQERPASGLANLLDMMMPDVAIHSSHLDVRGHDELKAAMAAIPIDWRAGHALKNWHISVEPLETRLEATIGYMTEDSQGSVATAEAHYVATFGETEALLPKLVRIDVVQGESHPGGRFVDMFVEHRVRSAVHYFFALVENPARDAGPFADLLAEDFELHFTPEPMTSHAGVRDWVAGPLSSVIASEHDLHSVMVNDAGSGHYLVEIKMKSQAMFPDGSGAISRNTQRWKMRDDVTERFPRIVDIRIDRDSVVRFDAGGRQTG